MKIIATIIEVNVGVAIQHDIRVDPYLPFVAVWQAPDGVRIWSMNSETKQGAINSLIQFVRKHMLDHHWLTIDEAELEI